MKVTEKKFHLLCIALVIKLSLSVTLIHIVNPYKYGVTVTLANIFRDRKS